MYIDALGILDTSTTKQWEFLPLENMSETSSLLNF